MISDGTETTEDRLTLRSQLSELAVVPSWIERLGTEYAIPEGVQFAMNLCLEEVLSNIIRHGYKSTAGSSISIQFTSPRESSFLFTVEDAAPHFDPLEGPEAPPVGGLEDTRIGGQGIRLLRRFAGSLEYEALPLGNRLKIGFSSGDPSK